MNKACNGSRVSTVADCFDEKMEVEGWLSHLWQVVTEEWPGGGVVGFTLVVLCTLVSMNLWSFLSVELGSLLWGSCAQATRCELHSGICNDLKSAWKKLSRLCFFLFSFPSL